MKVQPRTLSGFMELLPRQQMVMERIMEILRETYSLYGFTPLDTPIIEASEVLLAKGRRRDGEADLPFHQGRRGPGLRFDLTVPLAKYVALPLQRPLLPLPPLPDRQGLPWGAGPAGPVPGVLPGGHRTSSATASWT